MLGHILCLDCDTLWQIFEKIAEKVGSLFLKFATAQSLTTLDSSVFLWSHWVRKTPNVNQKPLGKRCFTHKHAFSVTLFAFSRHHSAHTHTHPSAHRSLLLFLLPLSPSLFVHLSFNFGLCWEVVKKPYEICMKDCEPRDWPHLPDGRAHERPHWIIPHNASGTKAQQLTLERGREKDEGGGDWDMGGVANS